MTICRRIFVAIYAHNFFLVIFFQFNLWRLKPLPPIRWLRIQVSNNNETKWNEIKIRRNNNHNNCEPLKVFGAAFMPFDGIDY